MTGTSPATPVISFDVGGTHLRCARLGPDGELHDRDERPTPRGPEALVRAMVAAARVQLDAAPAEARPVAVGAALSGFLDARAGVLRQSKALGVSELPLAWSLSTELGLPVRLVNDVNAAAWAEARLRGSDDLVAVFVGTGVGTGAVCGGRLLEGHRGAALEGGHLVFRPDGLDCGAARPGAPEHRGCTEAYLGGEALGRRARAAGVADDADGLLRAWRDGNAAAAPLMEEACAALADLVRRLVVIFDPERVVLGGGVARHAPELLQAARAAADPHPLGPGLPGVRVEAAMADKEAGLLGAAWLAGGPDLGDPAGGSTGGPASPRDGPGAGTRR